MKRLLWVFFGGVCLMVLAGIVVALRQPKPFVSAPLTLPDGSLIRIIGVTYGTNHMVGRPLARLVAHMPSPVQGVLHTLFGRRLALQCSTTTTVPELIVWLGRTTNNLTAPPNSGYLKAYLADASGFVSGEDAQVFQWWNNPHDLPFKVFPRRDPIITLSFFHHSSTGGVSRCGGMQFANPLHPSVREWKPEPLPATRRVGDLEATVDKLSTGHDHNCGYEPAPGGGTALRFGNNRLEGDNNTVCLIRLQALTHTNQVWRVAGAEVSDATGNVTRATTLGWGGYAEGYFSFAPGLWPSEPAWKLRCEVKRTEGFAPEETFTFRDVPLGSLNTTNRVGWMTNFAGVRVTLDHILRRAPNTNNSWSSSEVSRVKFTTAGLGNGLHLDLLSVRTYRGTNVDSGSWSTSSNERTYDFRTLPEDAKTADFTFAVQRSQWLEFILKPEVGTAQVVTKPRRKR